MAKFKRIHLVVLDSVGIGQAPDAEAFGDYNVHTLGHIAESMDLKLPHMEEMGLGKIEALKGIARPDQTSAYWGKLMEVSAGKDTMTGHWEIMGLTVDQPFRVFPEGFPRELIEQIKTYSKRDVIANRPASGTEIIAELGQEHMETGALIVYTSADSVLQVAAHEEVVPLEELYDICQYIRSITLEDPYMIGRIIARPFVGQVGNFQRTANRHDYALAPFGKTCLDYLQESGYKVHAVGKINDIFDGQGIDEAVRTKSNMDGVDKLIEVMNEDFQGLSFTNLVDFDALFGHRRDPLGYGKALEEFDARIPEIVNAMQEGDLLMLTADHGNDPTYKGTDHTREYVPLLVYAKGMQLGQGHSLELEHFSDIAATILDNFGVDHPLAGKSFLNQL